ncbi:CHAT domain-containing protein [Streptomyces olivochromogenes]|uniref:CHAT domain-containing protein n=1 Tax=Streptomyces olivochromogenes TaxID=1963 RepID=UPI0036D88AB1
MDESASLAPEDMKAEKAAAKRIALGDVSSSSHATVFGFAAAESDAQRAVDPVCPRTTLDAAGRETIGTCVDKLRGRTKNEGTGTDFPSAIRQGVHDLTTGTDPSQPRVLFLLTDGKLDVQDSPKYGERAKREAEGERQLTEALKDAAAQNVQIWPLGFGSDPDKKQLDRIAAGGYQKGCVKLPAATPKAYKVSGAKDVGSTLEKIFAAAHCLRYEEGPSKRPPATLEIGISPLATVGSIVVDKGDPEVKITYLDPNGHQVPTTGTYRKSGFELAGGSGTVEALKIVDPVPGTWRVKAEAPEGHRSVPVAVSVLWQGELRGAITMDPPSPQAGEKVTVTMRLQTREGYEIKDPRDYEGLRVRSELTGDGFSPLALDLADNGQGADLKANDGSFTGTATVPKDAAGPLKVSATLTASGLSTVTRSEGGQIAPGALPVTTALELPAGNTHPGGTVTGTLTVHNTTDTPHTLRLSIADLLPGLLSVSPDEIEVKPGESGTRNVTIEVAPADVFGDRLLGGLDLFGTLTVVDTNDYDRTLVRSLLSVRVTPEPSLWKRFRPAFLSAAVLIALTAAVALAWVQQHNRRKDPYGLVLRLVSAEGDVLGEHLAGHGHKQWYEFAVVEPHRSPRIERRAHGPYAIQRSPEGGAVLRKRGGGRTPLPARGQVQLTDTLSLALGEDTRASKIRRPQPAVRRAQPAPYSAYDSYGGDEGAGMNETPFESALRLPNDPAPDLDRVPRETPQRRSHLVEPDPADDTEPEPHRPPGPWADEDDEWPWADEDDETDEPSSRLGDEPSVVSPAPARASDDATMRRSPTPLQPDMTAPPTPPTRDAEADGSSAEPHHLVAELAEQTSPGREVPLHVQIVRGSSRGRGVRLRSFFLPPDGAGVLVTIHAPGLVVIDELQQELHIVPGRDSDVLLFRLKAPTPGLHQVTVRAFRGGTFLGEVTCQISVGHGSVTRDGPQRHAALPSMAFDPGEVTLQVLKDEVAGTFSFQLIGETFYPPEIIHFVGDSRQATEQIYAELRRAAKTAAANGGNRDAQRLRARLRNHGVQLWTSAVPRAVQRQFWDEADRVTAFTVLGEHDIIPWELLYPLNEGREDRGFLAEWLPVVRRVFGQDRVRSLSVPGVAFVVPPGSPADASMEVTSLRARLGAEVADSGVLTERAALTALIEDGHAGLLHFACHNAFTGTGSCVTMADGPFDPIDLASAAQLRTLRPHRPLVFFNACRSAGEIDWFGESLGWAPQFLNAGAGAFIGTLWPVRSQSALQFAEAFYDQFIANGQPLGHASLAARQTIRDLHGGDPTWLAYAVYGSPAATAHTTA